MAKIMKYLIALVLFLFIFSINTVKASIVSAPTILSVEENFVNSFDNNVILKGLTRADTEVDIYIDNIYQGSATVNHENKITDNFFFSTNIDLRNEGTHYISAVAWDKEFTYNSGHSRIFVFEIKKPTAPTLIIPNKESIVSKLKPRIIGLSESATFVHFYIDGVYNGKTEVLRHESGTANFAYTPFLNLSREQHIVWAVAEDSGGRKSRISNILRFTVENPAVSPSLFSPVVNNYSTIDQPFIVGLVKNDHKVQIYIDKKLNGEIYPEAHPSGTTNFAYRPFLKLKPGKHLIYTVAVDARGKESLWSNLKYYTIADPRISEQAVEDVVVKTIQYKEEKQKDDIEIIKNNEIIEEISKIQNNVSTSSLRANKEEDAIDVENIINPDKGDTASVAGVVNENEEKQNSMQANIVVFSLFLISVIAWIFWVNRELIKEKQKENKKD